MRRGGFELIIIALAIILLGLAILLRLLGLV